MSEEGGSKGWWQTLPGVVTSITAAVTALAGLIVAVKQTGWFDSQPPPAAAPSAPVSAAPLAQTPSAAAPKVAVRPVSPPPAPAAAAPHAVPLPALRDYKLGPPGVKATFTLLKAEVSLQTAEKDALRIRLRMMNHDRYDKNFWDRSFRLVVDGVPMAPEGGLNELVAGESAKEGDVLFVVPHGTAAARLRITYYEDSTEIPLDLKAAP